MCDSEPVPQSYKDKRKTVSQKPNQHDLGNAIKDDLRYAAALQNINGNFDIGGKAAFKNRSLKVVDR